ncbi:UDP-N-acetylglucosamine--LPS N-acetylglucosamine transferase [Bacillus sp. BRMEA1]|uniref:MGDG synthase family glycosyltransferase n=1 Tax=Neobacillus endophyticus TaxID=2738405 RepID=UPI001563A738|nr:glycosyltransferase [Neobacillus endophyticus]NRD78304.1 UDP-N-acetylglucosamine--LPS N-acetylglucosamine transferase [Neobacillus endophyticus]
MNKKILIISSDHTGHGHKSIAESLQEKMNLNKEMEMHVVDGFALGGTALLNIGKSYAPITRYSAQLWNAIWHFSAMNSILVDKFVEVMIRNNFLSVLNEVKPDLILSIHPNFNGSIINILHKENIRIPFGTLIADLVNIYPLWADPRADFILSPTEEAKEKCLEFGVPEEKINVVGFPVRERFHIDSDKRSGEASTMNFLMMSGGEGVGNMSAIAEELLNHFDCTVSIIAGRNEKLKLELETSLKDRFGDRAKIYGFVKNIQDLMLSADIAITRGSPNVMFESVATNLPIIITTALPGQEKDNPWFAEKHNLGVYCQHTENLISIIEDLLDDDGKRLAAIKESQRNFINKHAAEEILNFLQSAEKAEYEPVKKKFAFRFAFAPNK